MNRTRSYFKACILYYQPVVVVLLLTLNNWVAAQEINRSLKLETEQLLQYYRSLRNPSQQILMSNIPYDGKCGFRINTQVYARWKELTQPQREEFLSLMQPPTLQCDTVIGHFRIHYDTIGTNTPILFNNQGIAIGNAKAYIDSVASIFNYVWAVEIDQMGYTAPPFESGQSQYNIYVVERNGADYGITERINPQINGSDIPALYRSYIEIDNNYLEFPTKGIDGLRVTAAHEFHHSIQIGSYGDWTGYPYTSIDLYAYEVTSTWFEDVVYNDVNDYYYYLPNYFRKFGNTSSVAFSFSDNSNLYDGGYARCVWAHFLAKRYSPDIMLNVWTAMKNQQFLESTEAALNSRGSSLQIEYAEFSRWNYYTSDRADPVKYYPEGEHYPRYIQLGRTTFYNATATISGNVQPLSTSMYEFIAGKDTITAIVANVDIEAAKRRETTTRWVDVNLSREAQGRYNIQVSAADPSLWRSFSSQEVVRAYASPNPFRLHEAQQLLLPINEDKAGTANVYFFSSSFDLVYSKSFFVKNIYGTRAIEIPASEVKSKLSSGVYIIIAKTAIAEYTWKVAVIQ